MDTEDFKDRLQRARRDAGFATPTDAARAKGWTVSTYLGYENGDRKPGKDMLDKISRAFRVSADWLLYGRGMPRRQSGPQNHIDVYGYVGGGAEVFGVDDSQIGHPLEQYETLLPVPNGVVGAIVRGDSMYPRYEDGDVIGYIRRDIPPAELLNRECIVRTEDGRYYVKRLKKGTEPGRFNLESVNAPTLENIDVQWAAEIHTIIRASQWTKRP